MKIITEFNLPEEDCEYRLHLDGDKWALALQDVDNFLRDKLKYGNMESAEVKFAEDVRRHIAATLEDYGLSFNNIK